MKTGKKGCDLKSCFLCKLCIKEWLPALDANKKTFQYKKGELLFAEGGIVNGIYFLYEGLVKVHKKWGDDKELILRFARKGDIAGHRGLGKDLFYPVSATVLEPVTACFIDYDFFQSTLKVNYDFTYHLMMFFAAELKESERNMRNLAHMSVRGRVAQALLTLKEKFGVNKDGFIDITLSRQDIASFAGTTYETVFRIINEFTQDNIVAVAGKNILINDHQKLLQFTSQADV